MSEGTRSPGATRVRARDLAMGAGFAFSGRQGWIRTALTTVGVALGVAMLLFAASVPHMLSMRENRQDNRQINGSVAGNYTSANSGRATDRTLLSADANTTYHDQDISGRILQADGAHPVTPPGTDRIPKPGEMLASPALKRLLASDQGAELAKRLHARVVGAIGDDGLVGPSDLSFYLGADSLTAHNASRVSSFGGTEDRQRMNPVLVLLGAAACAVMLMPVAVFIGTAARFGGERRDQRLAALRLVGADTAMTRRIAAGESLAGTLLGVVLGGAAFLLVRQAIGHLTLFHLSVFPADVVPGVLLGLLVVVGVPVVSVAVSVLALRGVIIEPLGVMRASMPRPRRLWWRLLVPAVGLALLLPLVGALRGGGGANTVQVGAGVVLLLSGVALLLPWMVERLVGRLRGGPVSWQLAVRRLQMSSGTATRAVSGITIAVAGAIALQLLFTGAEAVSTHPTGQARADMRWVNIYDPTAKPSEAVRMTRALNQTKAVTSATGYLEGTQTVKGSEQDYAQVIVGDCAALREVARIGSCHDGQVFRGEPASTANGKPPAAGTALEVTGPGGHGKATWRVPAGAPTVREKKVGWDTPEAAILATPSALPVDRINASYTAWVRLGSDPEAMEHVRTTVFRQNPAATTLPMQETRTDAAFVEMSRAIFAAACGVLVLIAASMTLSQVEQLRERRRQLAVLAAYGTRRSTLSASVLWQSAVPVALGLVLASAFGLGLGWLLVKVLGQAVADWSVVWPMAGVGAALIAVVTLLSMPVLWRLMRTEGLRTE